MNYGSICSGVEAASLAWRGLGWTPKFFAEVEPFPSAVLQQKFGATKPLRPLDPAEAQSDKDRKLRESWAKQIAGMPDTGTVPNLGDFTKISTKDYDGTIDLIVGGTPCQSYSVAGLRKGLADPRGNLALEFVKLAYRTGVRWLLWENVPGVQSSGGGKDFASFLSLLCGWEVDVPKGGWRKCGIVTPAPGCMGLAWRIIDAQFTRVPEFPRAVPQRRRRLFVVGYLGSWEYPAQVLFDGEMLGGDTPPRRTKRQAVASCSKGSIGETDSKDVVNLIPYGMRLGAHQNGVASTITRIDAKFPQCVCFDSLLGSTKGQTENRSDTAETIRVRCGKPGGGKGALVSRELSLTLATSNDQTLITHPEVECLDTRQVEVQDLDLAPTLIATDYKGGKAISFYPYLVDKCPLEECSKTIVNGDCPGHQNAIAMDDETMGIGRDAYNMGQNAKYGLSISKNVQPTLTAKGPGAVCCSEQDVFTKDGQESCAEELICEWEVCPTLDAHYPNKMNRQDVGKLIYSDNTVICFENHGNDSRVTESDGIAPTITRQAGTGGNNLPLILAVDGSEKQTVAYNVSFCDTNGTRKDRPDGGLYVTEANACRTVTAGGANTETVIVEPVSQDSTIIALDGDKMAKAERKGGSGLGISTAGVMYTETVKDVHAVAYQEQIGIDPYNGSVTGKTAAMHGVNCGIATGRNGIIEGKENIGIDLYNGHETGNVAATVSAYSCATPTRNGPSVAECVPLDLRNATRDPDKHDAMNRQGVGVGEDGAPMNTVTTAAVPGVGWQAAVRRLLPVECERLMGFPDGHTLIQWNGKPESECPDAPRYKACGNSMCVNVMAWIGHRIDEVEKLIPSREGISKDFNHGGQNE